MSGRELPRAFSHNIHRDKNAIATARKEKFSQHVLLASSASATEHLTEVAVDRFLAQGHFSRLGACLLS